MKQIPTDPNATACYNSIQEAAQVNMWADNKAFKDHYLWNVFRNYDTCVSFQAIVKSKLAVPTVAIVPARSPVITTSSTTTRKQIPKKIRGECWTNNFGESTSGKCYCCSKVLSVFEDWHAGHIIARANGGTDTVTNLRPVCGACNLGMGTENMDDFKARCYPST